MAARTKMATGMAVGLPGEIFFQVRFEHPPLPANAIRLQGSSLNEPACRSVRHVQTLGHSAHRESLFSIEFFVLVQCPLHHLLAAVYKALHCGTQADKNAGIAGIAGIAGKLMIDWLTAPLPW